MKSVLLIGLGRFGMNIAEKLNEMKHEVLAVDIDENLVNDALPIVTNAQIGDSTDVDYLSTLGVENFDVCIVAIRNSFQNSLETTSLLKELGAKKVVACATNDVHEKFLLRNGADAVVYPEKQLAFWTAIRYTTNNIFDYIKIDDEYSIFEVGVPENWSGKTVSQLAVRQKHGINIMAIKSDNKLDVTITADTVLEAGERILVLGSVKAVRKCFDVD